MRIFHIGKKEKCDRDHEFYPSTYILISDMLQSELSKQSELTFVK